MPMDTVTLNGNKIRISYTSTKIGDTVYDRNSESTFVADIMDADDLNWIVQPPVKDKPIKVKPKRMARMSIKPKHRIIPHYADLCPTCYSTGNKATCIRTNCGSQR